MKNDNIANSLDIVPLIPSKKDLAAVKKSDDYETARGNMDNVIEVGTEAMTELAEMAKLSQDPRIYRVLTELLSAMTTANKELMEIKAKEVDIKIKEQSAEKEPAATVNQNLYVGSTAELLEILKNKDSTNE